MLVKAMVPGSRTRYDSYTYWPGKGVEKGAVAGTLMGKLPVSLKNYRWDKLPALRTFAEQKLGVDKPTSRYLLLQAPNEFNDDPAAFEVCLGDEYATGYVLASPRGRC
ncbi:hypothetical protein [Streptomyces sp. TLI_185]|uniref:hypothetical protein n=1 Tax=Streptomyces sp. TLI_185 TaxID=2485151 RepID=UPI00161C16C1|nr:hypothetical protein [Streptomyces sp. TLI_185]